MKTSAHVLVLLLTVAVVIFIIRLVALRQLRSKYALLWLGVTIVVLPFAVVPSFLDDVAHDLGFSYAPAFLLFLATGFLFAIVIHFSWELSRLETRVRTLAETVALLEVDQGSEPAAGAAKRGP